VTPLSQPAIRRRALSFEGLRSHDRSTVLVVAGFVLSRAIILAAALASELGLARNPQLTSGDPGFLLRPLTSWDGWWYLGIARDGYHLAALQGTYHDYAFLPLFPGLVRVLSTPFPAADGLIAVLLSNALFAVALGLLFVLGRTHLGSTRAAVACFLLAVSPFSFVFSMAYGESLFLVLALGAFVAAERDRRVLTGLLLALAALCRLQGAILALPLWLILLRQDGWRPRLSQAWLLLGPLAVAAFLDGVAWFTSSSGSYADNMAQWGRSGVGTAASSGSSLATGLGPIQVTQLVILCLSIWPLVYARADRMRLEYVLVPVLFLAAVFASGNLESVGRYVTTAFPIFWLMARRESFFWRRAWPVASVALLALFSTLAFTGYWVP
jgi:hypothetical protein